MHIASIFRALRKLFFVFFRPFKPQTPLLIYLSPFQYVTPFGCVHLYLHTSEFPQKNIPPDSEKSVRREKISAV